MTPLSGSAATSPRTTSCTEPCGAVAAKEISERRASRLHEFASSALPAPCVSAEAPTSTSGICVAADVHLRAHRADGGDEIDHPADFGFGFVVVEPVVARAMP